MTAWEISGQYCETCNCDFVCPCVPGGLAVQPSKGNCLFVMAFHIERGRFDDVPLDGLTFVLVGHAPEAMGKGNWSVGVLADERATEAQRAALAAITSGQAGGPIGALAPLVGRFIGMEPAPIRFTGEGLSWAVSIPGKLDMALDGVKGLGDSPEPLYLDNTGHPAADRFALAKARHSRLHALGFDWEDLSGLNNGQFARFRWANH